MLKLKKYQQETVEAIKNDFFVYKENRLVVCWPTGMGKTVLMAALPGELKITKKRVLVLVHRDELATQTAQKFKKFAPSYTVGVEMGSSYAGNAQVVVGGVQTLGRKGSNRLSALNPCEFALIMTDECHHAVTDSYKRIYEWFDVKNNKEILSLGVTATPNRADGKGLKEVFDKISYTMPLLDAVRQGWLCSPKGRKVTTSTDLDGVATKGHDFDLLQLSNTVNTPARNRLAAQAYLKFGEDRQFVAYCVDIQHSKDMASEFNAVGIPVAAVWGDDPDRAKKLLDHRAGKYKGLMNCQLLTEGYDDWQIGCIIQARPTESEALYTQIIGRGLRLPEGVMNLKEAQEAGLSLVKTDCLVLDLVDNTDKHTLATLPSLFGLNQKADFKGLSVEEVFNEIDKIINEHPVVDISSCESLLDLKAHAENVDLFKSALAPEIVQLSKYRWIKVRESCYVVLLKKNEHAKLERDILGEWELSGVVNNCFLEGTFDTFESALKEADYKIKMLGGKQREAFIKIKPTVFDGPPTEYDLEIADKYNIKVPPGVTSGEVWNMIAKVKTMKEWGQTA